MYDSGQRAFQRKRTFSILINQFDNVITTVTERFSSQGKLDYVCHMF